MDARDEASEATPFFERLCAGMAIGRPALRHNPRHKNTGEKLTWTPRFAARRWRICCIAAPSAFRTRPPSSAATPPGATRNSIRCAIAWPRVLPRAASARAPASPSSRATATLSRACGLRWRGSAPCWCRSISCSSRRRRPSSSSTPAPKCWRPTPASPRSRAPPPRSAPRCASSSGCRRRKRPRRRPA